MVKVQDDYTIVIYGADDSVSEIEKVSAALTDKVGLTGDQRLTRSN